MTWNCVRKYFQKYTNNWFSKRRVSCDKWITRYVNVFFIYLSRNEYRTYYIIVCRSILNAVENRRSDEIASKSNLTVCAGGGAKMRKNELVFALGFHNNMLRTGFAEGSGASHAGGWVEMGGRCGRRAKENATS